VPIRCIADEMVAVEREEEEELLVLLDDADDEYNGVEERRDGRASLIDLRLITKGELMKEEV
jgi:hypothetical protein